MEKTPQETLQELDYKIARKELEDYRFNHTTNK
jgi:hypothetical protein